MSTPLLLTPGPWPDYEYIDAGRGEKLERFGKVLVRRPEPQAVWDYNLAESEWKAAQAWFQKQPGSEEKGRWALKPNTPEKWWIEYPSEAGAIKFKISLSSFKHVGIFPEQAPNWDYAIEQCRRLGPSQVLNLFAYTGGASLAASTAGATVTHVEAIKQTVGWARENADAQNLTTIRWLEDDALRFTEREVRRGRKYQGLILDPPAYGRGPNGEKWILEEHLLPLMEACAQLLDPSRGFIILNLYSLGYSPLIGKNIAEQCLKKAIGHIPEGAQFGELCVGNMALPLGTFYRVGW